MARVTWADSALDDLDAIAAYISADSVRAALRVIEHIRSFAQYLEHSPRMGRPGADPGLQELVVSRYPYIIVYDLKGDEVRILSVVHQRRDRPRP